MTLPEATAALRGAGREMAAQGLTWGNAGNLSARLNDGTLLISSSGARLGELAAADFARCDLVAGGAAAGRPSKELPLHRAVYRARPEAGAVLHGAPLHATLLACSDLAPPAGLFVEGMYYLERVARVPYHHPGSQALADAVGEKAREANVLLLEHHGVLVFDVSVAEALMALIALEFASRLLLAARGAGVALRELPPETVADFLSRSGYRPRRRWPE